MFFKKNKNNKVIVFFQNKKKTFSYFSQKGIFYFIFPTI